jgi:hypothetical protein
MTIFFFIFLVIIKIRTNFRYFREANVSVKSVDSISVLWRLWDNPLKSGLCFAFYIQFMEKTIVAFILYQK